MSAATIAAVGELSPMRAALPPHPVCLHRVAMLLVRARLLVGISRPLCGHLPPTAWASFCVVALLQVSLPLLGLPVPLFPLLVHPLPAVLQSEPLIIIHRARM